MEKKGFKVSKSFSFDADTLTNFLGACDKSGFDPRDVLSDFMISYVKYTGNKSGERQTVIAVKKREIERMEMRLRTEMESFNYGVTDEKAISNIKKEIQAMKKEVMELERAHESRN